MAACRNQKVRTLCGSLRTQSGNAIPALQLPNRHTMQRIQGVVVHGSLPQPNDVALAFFAPAWADLDKAPPATRSPVPHAIDCAKPKEKKSRADRQPVMASIPRN